MIRRTITTLPGHCRKCGWLLVTLSILSSLEASATDLRIARYSTIQPVPTRVQQDPLAAPITGALPAFITRVGEAVEILLAPSGYRLAPTHLAPPERAELLNLPLPETHRRLGPLPIRTALKILAGPAFTLMEDPVHRLISFERCEQATGKR